MNERAVVNVRPTELSKYSLESPTTFILKRSNLKDRKIKESYNLYCSYSANAPDYKITRDKTNFTSLNETLTVSDSLGRSLYFVKLNRALKTAFIHDSLSEAKILKIIHEKKSVYSKPKDPTGLSVKLVEVFQQKNDNTSLLFVKSGSENERTIIYTRNNNSEESIVATISPCIQGKGLPRGQTFSMNINASYNIPLTALFSVTLHKFFQ